MPPLDVLPLIDYRILDELYRDPYINRVGHDDRPAEPLNHPAVKYYGAYVDGELVGAFMLIESGFIEVDVHALLSRAALPYSRQLGQLFVSQVFLRAEIERITAYVIEGLETALNYCLKIGFKFEGTRRKASRKNGKLLDLHILGMTRNDWKESQWAS